MDAADSADPQPLCPSAPPQWDGSVVFGIVGGSADAPQPRHLAEPQPVTDELLALSGPVEPTEVFRFAAPCAAHACGHFDGGNCILGKKLVQLMPEATQHVPPCR